tara:strand:+ start:151 stop:765 length:615 start_codon:yes stop_codon:yes gene_type:complete
VTSSLYAGASDDAGLGVNYARINVYIANRPNYRDLSLLNTMHSLNTGDIEAINRQCGNGWRKVFNVYAKLVFAWRSVDPALHACLPGAHSASWQAYRDTVLLQQDSQTALLFSPPSPQQDLPYNGNGWADGASTSKIHNAYHIIMGRTYAKSLVETTGLNLTWHGEEFAIDQSARTAVCPYFDYRQLSNIKIIRLVELLKLLNQ